MLLWLNVVNVFIRFFSCVLVLFRISDRFGLLLCGKCRVMLVCDSCVVKCVGFIWFSRFMVGMFSDSCSVVVELIGLLKVVLKLFGW